MVRPLLKELNLKSIFIRGFKLLFKEVLDKNLAHGSKKESLE